MYFHDAKGRETKELAPGVTTKTFWGQNMLLSYVEIEPDSAVPNHTHPHEQGGIVVEGEMEMEIAGEARVLKPGDMYIIPGNVEHKARSISGRAVALDIFSPVREEFKY